MQRAIKWQGGKHYLADRIIDLMPEHLHYVEPYFGGGAVLFAKDPHGTSEVINDISLELTNFWRVLQHRRKFKQFCVAVQLIPFSEWEWSNADESSMPTEDVDVNAAVHFFVRCRQSRAGNFDSFATITRNRTRREMNEQVASWLSAIDGLPQVHQRLQRVLVLHGNAVGVIRTQDGPNTLFYLDPPYMHSTRASKTYYRHEMTDEKHIELLQHLAGLEGSFILSGYHSEIYDGMAEDHGWRVVEVRIDNKASGAKQKPIMTEVLYMNYGMK